MFSLFPEEDRYDSYSRMLLKYFLAEGVVCGHELFVASAQDHPDEILQVPNIICLFFFLHQPYYLLTVAQCFLQIMKKT